MMSDDEMEQRIGELMDFIKDEFIDTVRSASSEHREQLKKQLLDPKVIDDFKKEIVKEAGKLRNTASKPLRSI